MSQSLSESLAVVNLDVSIWAGRAKVRPEDLPSDVLSALPPAELATLGSKRLYPIDALRPFNALKMRAYTLLCQHGTRFLSGFAVDRMAVPSIEVELDKIRTAFDGAVNTFCSTYDEGVQNWQASFPQWSAVLAAATPSASEVSRRFSFRYQIYTIAGYGATDNLSSDLSALPCQAVEDIAQDVRNLLRDTYTDGRQSLKGKALNPLKTLCGKVDALCFLNNDFNALSGILRNAVSNVEHDPDGPAVPALRTLLISLSDAAGIERIAQNMSADTAWQDALDQVCAPAPAVSTFVPNPVNTTAPVDTLINSVVPLDVSTSTTGTISFAPTQVPNLVTTAGAPYSLMPETPKVTSAPSPTMLIENLLSEL